MKTKRIGKLILEYRQSEIVVKGGCCTLPLGRLTVGGFGVQSKHSSDKHKNELSEEELEGLLIEIRMLKKRPVGEKANKFAQ